MIRRISMVIIMQSDLDAAVAFYQCLTGLTLRFHLPKKWAEFDLDGTKIGLCPLDPQTPALEPSHTGLILEITDLMAFYEQSKDTIKFVGQPIVKPHGIMLRIQDPSGNLIDLYEPTPEQLQDLVRQVKERTHQGCTPEQVGKKQGCCKDEPPSDACC